MYEDMLKFVKEYLESSEINATQLAKKFPFRNRFEHTLRVCKWADRINKIEKGNGEIVKVAAIFHDVGKANKGGLNHAQESAKICEAYLRERGFDSKFVAKVVKTIRLHSSKDSAIHNLSLEERIIIDADLLDETGAMTVLWDSMATGAQQKQSYNIVYERVGSALEDRKMGYKYLKTKEGKRLYKERLDFLELFIHNLKYELGLSRTILAKKGK